ncbi:MAG: DEAD/DEAH box helicase [bacterium]|nr:DEAD/DEAH box helicase [bacterium]
MGSPPSSSDPAPSSVFHRFHPGVQRWIWDQGWKALRPVQERAAQQLLDRDEDVIISAPTAGGKTEAAFLPIASRAASCEAEGIACLCVSPLKALINDQANRLTSLFDRVDLPLTPWHGDVPQSRKQKLLKNRKGVLLITPESLEAFFVLRGTKIPTIFAGLSHVVVDELHSFIGTERGRQLQSLLDRMELAIRKRVPRVALSATLGDMRLAAEALRPGAGEGVVLIEGDGDGRELRMQLRGYKSRPPASGAAQSTATDEDDAARLVGDLYESLRGQNNLVFANSRRRVEELTDRLRRLCEQEHVPNEFFAHHGNLSREIREEAESRIKENSRPTSVVCTSTLELGIDIGSVTSIAQVGSPPSVASLRQRLGRSGRLADDPSVLRGFVVEEEIGKTSTLIDELRAQLVQSIAMVQLLLAGWCEPPAPRQLHLSTLVQQTLSVIAQHGGVLAKDLYGALCKSGPFRGVDAELFRQLLHCLGEQHILSQTSDGALTLGDRGEPIVDHYSFYVAFVTPDEYRLVAGSKTLGTMPITQPLIPGSHLIFAGRRWEVRDIDEKARVIELTPARGGRAPQFDGGGFDIHDRVRAEMYRMYSSSMVPIYLDAAAKGLLTEGRDAFVRWDLAETRMVDAGGSVLLFPWRGDRVMHTLCLQLNSLGLSAWMEGIAIGVRKAAPEAIAEALGRVERGKVLTGQALAATAANQIEEKYDWVLTPELRSVDYASRHFDEPGARDTARDILASWDRTEGQM